MNSEKPEKPKLNPRPQIPNQQSNTEPQPKTKKSKKNIDLKTNHNKDASSSKGKRKQKNTKLPPPSPWLTKVEPEFTETASFVEYLRWMRPPHSTENESYKKRDNDAKLQLLSIAEDQANYSKRLASITERTRKIVKSQGGIIRKVTCPWRIRVGGHRGPESILLPAFDALGLPYIPSSTLRGVARNQAIRDLMTKEDLKWDDAIRQISLWFGSLDTEKKSDRMGKIIFLDAYPFLNKEKKDKDLSGGLAIDIANNIWSWDENYLNYSPNPNIYFSLQEPTFLVGIIPRIKGEEGKEICNKVKKWLIKGLANGAGAQINSGYGRLVTHTKNFCKKKIYQLSVPQELFRVNFCLEGQLVNTYKKLSNPYHPYKRNSQTGDFDRDKKQQLKLNDQFVSEIRPTAFKSLLRYWFRALTLGIWDIDQVKTWEAQLFGSIDANYKKQGWLKLNVLEITDLEEEDKFENTQQGVLIFALSSESPHDKQEEIKILFKNLLWIMSFLGGVGLGARRPYHQRNGIPQIRGSSLEIFPSDENDQESNFWQLPSTVKKCKTAFSDKTNGFYNALGELVDNNENAINSYPLKSVENAKINEHYWIDVLDNNCEIWVTLADQKKKPHALQELHDYYHSLEEDEYSMAKSLCGGTDVDYPQDNIKRDVTPSPIWITNYDMSEQVSYQIITVFGAGYNPRKEYLRRLNIKTEKENIMQIFPLGDKDKT